jgi:hypothetical protein
VFIGGFTLDAAEAVAERCQRDARVIKVDPLAARCSIPDD